MPDTAPQPPYVLAIDAGTEAIKAGLFDLAGRRVAVGVRSYPTYFPGPAWAEQDPGDWWNGLVGAVATVCRPPMCPGRRYLASPPTPLPARSCRCAPTGRRCAALSCGWTCVPASRRGACLPRATTPCVTAWPAPTPSGCRPRCSGSSRTSRTSTRPLTTCSNTPTGSPTASPAASHLT